MNPTRTNLESAAVGLLIISESEAPLHYFEAPATEDFSDELFVRLAGQKAGTPVHRMDIDYFFRNMVKFNPGSTAIENTMAERFKKLVNILKDELTDITVYRVGTRQIDAFIAGRTKTGGIAGLQTRQIET